MSDETRTVQPVDRQNVIAALNAMRRQIDLLGWHVKQLRADKSGTVASEIDSGLELIKRELSRI